jgi:hypothetical protein
VGWLTSRLFSVFVAAATLLVVASWQLHSRGLTCRDGGVDAAAAIQRVEHHDIPGRPRAEDDIIGGLHAGAWLRGKLPRRAGAARVGYA